MYKQLRKEAKKQVQAKKTFYITAIVFGFVSIILLMIGSYAPSASFWLSIPILAFIMVLAILYLQAFGFPGSDSLSEDWEENEVEKEMVKLYKKKRRQIPPTEELNVDEILELKELERLEEKHEWKED